MGIKLGKQKIIATLLFLVYAVLLVLTGFDSSYQGTIYTITSTYGFIALFGGVAGLLVARKWGGLKSVLGRAIIFLSLGLLAQEVGQLIYLYYIDVAMIEIPYPSLGDLGYFGSIPLYAYGTWLIAKVAGAKIGIRSTSNKIVALLIPTVILVTSYLMFLQDYQFNWGAPLAIFLDFGYPLGQAIYISIALVAFILSGRYLGGAMKKPIIFVLIALTTQYIADFTFLYQVSRGIWQPASINDFMYILAYYLMAYGILSFNLAGDNLKNKAT